MRNKISRRLAAVATALAVGTIPALAVPTAASAATHRSYSQPTRVYYGQPCTAGHSEGIPANRTVITLTYAGSLYCNYRITYYTFWQNVDTDYLTLNKIQKQCPGAPIRKVC